MASFMASFGEVPVFGPILGLFIQPMEDELGWSRKTIALGFFVGSVTGQFSSIIVGRLVDRYGSRVVVTIAGVFITVALLGLSTVNEPWQFWALFGLGRGSALAGVEIGTSVAVAKWFYRKRGRALAVKGIGQRGGQAILPVLIFAVMSASDWRTAYVALAGLAAITIVIPAALLLRRQPEDVGLVIDGTPASGTAASRSSSGDNELSFTLAQARRTKAFWLVGFFMVGTPFVMGGTNLHMVANFQDRGLSDALAVSMLSVFAAVSSLSILPVGLLLERIHIRFGAMIMSALVFVAMLIISVADTLAGALLFAVVFGVAAGMRNLVETMLIADYFGREALGSIKGFMAPLRVVSPLGPVYAGIVRDSTGEYTIAFLTFAAMLVGMVVLLVFASPPRLEEARDRVTTSSTLETPDSE
jgi:MFS family permease